VLNELEARVLGCLVEKERTTPDQYPLSANALVSACNQTTSRDPLMHVDEHAVLATLAELKANGYVRFVHPSHGRSVTRYRHIADEVWTTDAAETAVLAVLLLRGPQTVAELRTRCERLHRFDTVDDVERVLRSLAVSEKAVQLERVPGTKEPRWQQLLADEPERAVPLVASTSAPTVSGGLADRVAQLEARVERLEAALADLL
jgi:uncharacterized protein